jgi:hypothetical protein
MESTPKVLKRRLHSSVMRCTRPPTADYSGFSKMVRFITACPLSLTYLNNCGGRSLHSCVLCNKERSDTRVLGVLKKAVSTGAFFVNFERGATSVNTAFLVINEHYW